MGDPVTGAIAGGVASSVTGKLLGGGSRQPTTEQQKVEGVEFQPFTYKGTGGFGVTGTQEGDYGYQFGAELPSWLTNLGAGGAEATGGLFKQYYDLASQDPYAMADEYYKRGMDVLTPQFEQQNIDLQERLFGSGRLGQKVGGVNPLAYSQQKAQQETLAKLYQTSIDAGQQLQNARLNQLSQAAEAAKNLGMLPMMTEQDLINFAKDLEVARSNALKQGTQNVSLGETPQSVFAGQLANTVGSAVSDNWSSMFSSGASTSSPWFAPQVSQPVAPTSGYSFGGPFAPQTTGVYNTMPSNVSGFTFGGY